MLNRQEPTSENIFVDLILAGEFWDRPPEMDVLVNGEFINHYVVDSQNYHVRFRHTFNFTDTHTLEIHRQGKTNDQNRILPDGTYQGQSLHIKQVKLDNIDLRNLVWHSCRFRPEYPEPWATEQRAQNIELEQEIVGETYLGHNGIWKFDFTSPIYKFLVGWARGNVK